MTALTNLTIKLWRQDGPDAQGRFETHQIPEISDEASFLELLDILNERLIEEGKEAVVFDHDCREGICGTCSLMIDGQAHGPQRGTATCQLHMRSFNSGDEIVVEPWRAAAFPIIKDLMVDRSAFDRIIEVGGFITAPTGGAPDANLIPIPKPVADASMDAAECIGCGACVAACPNGAANLFTAAKLVHLNLLPQGQAERFKRSRGDGREDGRVLRFLHEPRRVRSGVSEGDLDRHDRHDEHRLPEVEVQEPQVAVADLSRTGATMSTLELRHLNKQYAGGDWAVRDFSLVVGDGEFFVIVGPSGCGKSTVLRMVAGLEQLDRRRRAHRRQERQLGASNERDVAMAFQDHALYPHMTVAENIGFPMWVDHVHQSILERRIQETANALQLTDVLHLQPRQLSGGQRQRTALGRAIVRNPGCS